jgi:hypothetical protein
MRSNRTDSFGHCNCITWSLKRPFHSLHDTSVGLPRGRRPGLKFL